MSLTLHLHVQPQNESICWFPDQAIQHLIISIRMEGLETVHVRHAFQCNVERAILAVANRLCDVLPPRSQP